ncbi:MAG: CHAT domain-containing protein [Roseiflexus sp.]|nr:CHAT domain-containing protein [Roseiflexus sp.]MDW8146260.1 CHAT domain-containing protein [Roseiflexaceae bacterium]
MIIEHPAVRALLDLWTDLSRSAVDPARYWRALDLLRRYAAARDSEERSAVALEVQRLLRDLPDGRATLRRYLEAASGQRGDVVGSGAAPAGLLGPTEAASRLHDILDPPAVTRYTDIYAPARVTVGARFPVVVGLTRSPADDQESRAIQARLNELIRVVLTPRGPELLSEPVQTLRVEEGDSQPVVFYLRATEVGLHSVVIDFYRQSHLLASITHTLEAQTVEVSGEPGKLPGQPVTIGDYRAPFPDLVLRVVTKDNRLTYTLNYATTEERIINGGVLRGDPEQYRYQTIREIEQLAKGLDIDGYRLDSGDLLSGMRKIGWRLYNELFNDDMRLEYRERIRGRVRTIEIVSDEPWIPWELIRPFDDGVDDDFLCMQYDLSRWVSGGAAPAAEIAVQSLACIAPTDSGLTEAQHEAAFVRGLANPAHRVDRSPAAARRDLVEALLTGNDPVHLWHFACHGEYDAAAPGNSPLILEGGRRLRPHDVVGPAQTRLRTDRPLVFLNACRAGQSGLALTGMGGWAKTLVQDCHVGALIAPLWRIPDGAARHFAETFYQATQQPGATLAVSLQRARQRTHAAFPGDPMFLAYTLYAHPNARLVW